MYGLLLSNPRRISVNGVFYDCIEIRIYRTVVVALVSWILHCALETHECCFLKRKCFRSENIFLQLRHVA